MKQLCNIYVIADTHFLHSGIIEYCGRPFTANEQDESLIRRWNIVVKNTDLVIHMGDFALHKESEHVINIIKSLNGRKILVKGNHDRKSTHWYLTHGFDFVCNSFVLDDILFTHRPIDNIEKWRYNIFGHIHDKVIQKYENSKYICISVERINYTPILLKKLIEVKK